MIKYYILMLFGACLIGLTAENITEIFKLLGLAFIIIGAIKDKEL